LRINQHLPNHITIQSHRSQGNRSQQIADESDNNIIDRDNPETESTASASVHDSVTDSKESIISGPDSEDLEVTRISKTSII
jgi:hypothetical protein